LYLTIVSVTAETYTLRQAIDGGCVLMLQIDTLIVYVLAFSLLADDEPVAASRQQFVSSLCIAIIVIDSILFLLFAVRTTKENNSTMMISLMENVNTLIVFVCFGYGFSPVLRFVSIVSI
jgi:hypothetical protein